jgi:hypothetical protein
VDEHMRISGRWIKQEHALQKLREVLNCREDNPAIIDTVHYPETYVIGNKYFVQEKFVGFSAITTSFKKICKGEELNHGFEYITDAHDGVIQIRKYDNGRNVGNAPLRKTKTTYPTLTITMQHNNSLECIEFVNSHTEPELMVFTSENLSMRKCVTVAYAKKVIRDFWLHWADDIFKSAGIQ